MIVREPVKDWRGRILGFIETDTQTGNKKVKDFYGKIKGKYNKRLDITQDFYGRKVSNGEQLLRLLDK